MGPRATRRGATSLNMALRGLAQRRAASYNRAMAARIRWLMLVGCLLTAGAAHPRSNGPHFLDLLSAEGALTRSDQVRLGRGDPLARVLVAPAGQIAVLAMVDTRATPESLAESVRDIATLKRSNYVRTIRRFSSPPVLSDLDELLVSPEDRKDIEACKPSDCGIKLTPPELVVLGRGAGATPSPAAEGDALDRGFRTLVLTRVQRYLSEGRAVAHDAAEPAQLTPPFERILSTSPYVTSAFPRLSDFLRHFPRHDDGSIESFLYWSVESFGRKPVVVVTHVAILHPTEVERARGVSLMVAGKQVFATHYTDASLSLTALVDYQGRRYLTYVNRSETDALGGVFGWLKRTIVERRVRNEAASILSGVRRRVESRMRPE